MTVSNAVRFINAYNSIDYSLKTIYNMKRGLSFADAVHRIAGTNYVIRKYEDKLIDYGRLRNSIVHGNSDKIIAEPHDDVTEEIEKIAELLSTPPLAMSIAKNDNIIGVSFDDSVKNVMKTFYETGFENFPVYKDETIIGVANLSYVALCISKAIAEGKDAGEYISKTSIEKIVEVIEKKPHYEIKSEELTIDEALSLFTHNHKLACILITKRGNFLEKPIGILTTGNIIQMNKIIDDYQKNDTEL